MAIKGFRLGSIVANGVGGPETGAISFIYAMLLHEHKQDFYSILINQIDSDLNEFISKGPGKKIHINIQYPIVDNFNNKNIEEKNKIRLDVIHESMLRIAKQFKDYDVSKLEEIRNTILESKFSFEFAIKRFQHSRNKVLCAKIIVKPMMYSFEYYAVKEQNGSVISRIPFYSGSPTLFYLPKFFQKAKWKGESEIILTGTDNIVETHINFDEKKAQHINLTPYSKPPYFELMKANISKADKEKYSKDWEHSLPPHIVAVLKYEAN